MIYYAIGDIHGCAKHLKTLLDEIIKNEPGTIVTLGDYIDRGPDSKGVIDLLMDMQKVFESLHDSGWNMVNLMGNHEDMCISNSDFQTWMINGGVQTLDSYAKEEPYERRVSKEHMIWMHQLWEHYETEDYIFVHAGLHPGIELDDNQPFHNDRHTKLWIRDEFLNSKYDWGKKIIHGHTPRRNVEELPNRINIDTAAVFEGDLTCVVLKGKGQPLKFIQAFENPLGDMAIKTFIKEDVTEWPENMTMKPMYRLDPMDDNF